MLLPFRQRPGRGEPNSPLEAISRRRKVNLSTARSACGVVGLGREEKGARIYDACAPGAGGKEEKKTSNHRRSLYLRPRERKWLGGVIRGPRGEEKNQSIRRPFFFWGRRKKKGRKKERLTLPLGRPRQEE